MFLDQVEKHNLFYATVVTKNGDEIYSISGDIGYNGFLNLLKSYLK